MRANGGVAGDSGACVDSCYVHEQNIAACAGQISPNCVGWTALSPGSLQWNYTTSIKSARSGGASRRRRRLSRATPRAHEVTKCATKKSVFFSKIKKKSVFLPVFSRNPNSFRGPGGFCWLIGVTAALLGRLLPSDGHKLVKKPEI